MLLGYGEFLIDTVVALALIVGGTILLGVVMYDFVSRLGQGPFVVVVLELLSGLLLVFIFTELITTIRVVIARRKVVVEPFLIVGIVAAVRRLIVISAEAENLLGTPKFRDVMLEIAILAGTVRRRVLSVGKQHGALLRGRRRRRSVAGGLAGIALPLRSSDGHDPGRAELA